LICNDTLATINVCSLLGACIEQKGDRLIILGPSELKAPTNKIDCRESHKIPDEKCDECGLRYDCWTGTEFLDILIMFYSMLGDKYGKKDTTSEM
jgi:hypothetical protein